MATVTRLAGVTNQPKTPGEIRWYPEAASQSFKRGQFVYLSGGKVTVCAAAPGSVAGMAMADASGTVDTAIPVCIAKRGQQFSIHCSGATAVTQIGKQFPMSVTSNICYVNIAAVTSTTFVVDDIDNCDAVGDTYGRLIVEVRGIRAQLDQTTS